MRNQFEIKILKLNWLKGLDESLDLCAHGKVSVRIGEETVCDESDGEWTLSATGLSLMRTFFKNYEIGDFSNQLLPHCGHFLMPDEVGESVEILGCPTGIDWSVKHIEKNRIRLKSEKGKEGVVDKKVYRKLVLDFVNQLEQFYENSLPKKMPDDEYDRKGYITFWKEWRRLKKQIINSSS